MLVMIEVDQAAAVRACKDHYGFLPVELPLDRLTDEQRHEVASVSSASYAPPGRLAQRCPNLMCYDSWQDSVVREYSRRTGIDVSRDYRSLWTDLAKQMTTVTSCGIKLPSIRSVFHVHEPVVEASIDEVIRFLNHRIEARRRAALLVEAVYKMHAFWEACGSMSGWDRTPVLEEKLYQWSLEALRKEDNLVAVPMVHQDAECGVVAFTGWVADPVPEGHVVRVRKRAAWLDTDDDPMMNEAMDVIFRTEEGAKRRTAAALADALETARTDHALLEGWIASYATEEQRERHAEGLLPREERLTIARKAVFAPFDGTSRFHAIPVDDVCKPHCQTRGAVFATCPISDGVSAEVFAVLKRVRVIAADLEGASVQLVRHSGACPTCGGVKKADAVRVTVTRGTFTFSREFGPERRKADQWTRKAA